MRVGRTRSGLLWLVAGFLAVTIPSPGETTGEVEAIDPASRPGLLGAVSRMAGPTRAPATPSEASISHVAVLWIGADPSPFSSGVDVKKLQAVYASRGFRLLTAQAVEPMGLRILLGRDRRLRPQDYTGTRIPFIVHGQAAIAGRLSSRFGPVLDLPYAYRRQVSDRDLIEAFLAGIGPEAVGEVVASGCFAGLSCRDVELGSMPFGKRLGRLVVPDARRIAGSVMGMASLESQVLEGLMNRLITLAATPRTPDALTARGAASHVAVPPKDDLLSRLRMTLLSTGIAAP